jgi:hypothetical protein
MSTTSSDTFMLLLRGGVSNAELSPEQMQRQIQKYMSWIERLRAKNQFIAGEPLEDDGKVLSGNGGRTVTDGPFTEAKEVVGGYFIIRARDLDEAIEVSRGCPIFENGGSVEVRPIQPVPAS